MSALSRRRWDYDLLRVASMVGWSTSTPRQAPCASLAPPVALLQPALLPGHGGGALFFMLSGALLLSHPGRRSWAPCFAAACPRC
ncbi:MAG: hypothetical protein ACLRNV_08755 [Flavonifractor plautii]